MIFFKRKTYPESYGHPAVVNFLKGELRLDWSQAMTLLETGMSKDLKYSRTIDDGVLIYRFKSKNIIPHLERITGAPAKQIIKHLDTIAAREA